MKRVEDIVDHRGRLREKARASLQRKKRVSQKRKKSRVGKLGIVRLAGADLEALRRQCFERDDYACRDCGRRVAWSEQEEQLVGSKWAWSNAFGFPVGQMAHIRTKRNNGDTLDNVRTLCPDCHTKEHQYGPSGKKPCPSKGRGGQEHGS